MSVLLPVGAVIAGVLLLVKGGGRLVQHGAHLAASYRVPKSVVGAVVLGFGTSLPELFVCLAAAHDGSPGIALGNAVGSNIANIGLILGVGACVSGLYVQRNVLRADLPLGVLAALFFLLWVGGSGEMTRATGALILVAFAFYLWSSMRFARRNRTVETDHARTPLADGLWIVAALIGIVAGAELLVYGAAEMARMIGVSERVIGITVVAVGTSLPELVATVIAARRNEMDLAVGNVAGSNLFNLLFVLGTTAVYQPLPVPALMVERDLPVLAAFSVLAFPLFSRERRISRTQGCVMIAAYAAYIAWTFLSGRDA